MKQIIQKKIATRAGIKKGLSYYSKLFPNLYGGAADLGSSCGSVIEGETVIQSPTYHGKQIQFGIREHAMGGILNGLQLLGGFKTFGGTFFVFTNYMIPAIRMSCLMKLPVNYYFSHDSVYVGEDGPSHQPVEHLHQFRLIPNIKVWRPCDINETMYVQGLALLDKNSPNIIITTRQIVPVLDREQLKLAPVENAKFGGYIIYHSSDEPDAIIIATGSEIYNSIIAAKELEKEGYKINVINMVSTNVFDLQPQEYKDKVLPPNVRKRLAVEASKSDFWYKYVGLDGKVIGVDKFGVSGHFTEMEKLYGFDIENIKKEVLCLLNK